MTRRVLAPGSRSTSIPYTRVCAKSRLSGVHAPSYAEPDVMALKVAPTLILSLALLAAPPRRRGPAAWKVWRIGILSTLTVGDISGADPPYPHIRMLVQGLRELGWVYAQNLVTEPRGAGGQLARFPALRRSSFARGWTSS
jgi:hypothetical protein